MAVEADSIMYTCEVNYRGKSAPVLQWKNKGGVLQANNETTNTTAKYTYATKLTAADNGHVFTCVPYFEKPKGLLDPHMAKNAPSVDNLLTTYTSPKINFYCK